MYAVAQLWPCLQRGPTTANKGNAVGDVDPKSRPAQIAGMEYLDNSISCSCDNPLSGRAEVQMADAIAMTFERGSAVPLPLVPELPVRVQRS